ncbi:MAG: cytochrome c peroxidase [Bacteroidia bacterium]|nr:c-type cytochrome [Bacteroidia bacterium]MDW8333707.1 cytochrome c peroxidase [Bacteroidia bacterium]
MNKAATIFALATTTLLAGCKSEATETPSKPTLDFAVPAGFPPPVYRPVELTEARFELGKMLFYDPVLSRDGSISCASCHKQFAAFADFDHRVSHGIDEKLGTRNAPGLFNLAWRPFLFWDGGVQHLELFSVAPIENPVEMDEKLENVLNKLRRSPRYVEAFRKAWGDDSITSARMLKSLAQFMAMLVSADSKYDRYTRGEESLSSDEQEGLALFERHCASCHPAPLFTSNDFVNNGLDSTFKDLGRALITLLPQDEGKFLVPSLRNVALTPPYMHDGRFSTLEQVLRHYAMNVKKSSPNLDARLKNGIPLSDQEQKKIIAFLHTLSDRNFTADPRFRDPF